MLSSKRCVLARHTGGHSQYDGRNSFRLRLAHRRLISLHQGEKWQFYCRLPGWLNPSVCLNTAIGDSIETKRGVFGALPGLYRGCFRIFRQKSQSAEFP